MKNNKKLIPGYPVQVGSRPEQYSRGLDHKWGGTDHDQIWGRFPARAGACQICPQTSTKRCFPQFCVEYGNTTKSIVAVMCNPCRGSEVILYFAAIRIKGTICHLPSPPQCCSHSDLKPQIFANPVFLGITAFSTNNKFLLLLAPSKVLYTSYHPEIPSRSTYTF